MNAPADLVKVISTAPDEVMGYKAYTLGSFSFRRDDISRTSAGTPAMDVHFRTPWTLVIFCAHSCETAHGDFFTVASILMRCSVRSITINQWTCMPDRITAP